GVGPAGRHARDAGTRGPVERLLAVAEQAVVALGGATIGLAAVDRATVDHTAVDRAAVDGAAVGPATVVHTGIDRRGAAELVAPARLAGRAVVVGRAAEPAVGDRRAAARRQREHQHRREEESLEELGT